MPNDEDRARRLAACWNACEGIDTEDLEAGSVSIIKKLHDKAAQDVLAQRDELLGALRMLLSTAGEEINDAPDGLLEMALESDDQETRRQANAFLVARAVIAKVEGGAA